MNLASEPSPSGAPRRKTHLLVNDDELYPVNAQTNLSEYLKRTLRLRAFIHADARNRALSSGRETFLGNIWIILNPILQVVLYILVFGIILRTNRGIENFVGFLVIGVTFFGFITQGLSTGCGLLKSSKSLITSFSFPKAAVPLSRSLRNVYDNIIPALIAIVVAIAFQPDYKPSFSVFLSVPLFALMAIFSCGLMLLSSRATTFVPDVKSLINLLTRGLFFISGIFFSVERFTGHAMLQSIMNGNPVYRFLSGMRRVVMEGSFLSPSDWAIMIAWSFGTFAIGLFYFWKGEERYANHI